MLSFKPIQSINGKALSWIVSYEEDSFIADTLETATKVRVILFVLLMFVFYFVYRVLNQQQQLKLQSNLAKSNETLEKSLKDIQHISMEQKRSLYLIRVILFYLNGTMMKLGVLILYLSIENSLDMTKRSLSKIKYTMYLLCIKMI